MVYLIVWVCVWWLVYPKFPSSILHHKHTKKEQEAAARCHKKTTSNNNTHHSHTSQQATNLTHKKNLASPLSLKHHSTTSNRFSVSLSSIVKNLKRWVRILFRFQLRVQKSSHVHYLCTYSIVHKSISYWRNGRIKRNRKNHRKRRNWRRWAVSERFFALVHKFLSQISSISLSTRTSNALDTYTTLNIFRSDS